VNDAQPTWRNRPHGAWRFAVFALGLLMASPALHAQPIWILIDTHRMTLSVMDKGKAKRIYRNISIGRGGATLDKRRQDDATPLGHFHISRIARHSAFHRFFGIDYPDMARARRALKQGMISGRQFLDIRDAFRAHRTPPQDTPLGGYIGIHGVGAGNPQVHADFNWTSGCIALTNAQIDDLARWIRIGMPVVIR